MHMQSRLDYWYQWYLMFGVLKGLLSEYKRKLPRSVSTPISTSTLANARLQRVRLVALNVPMGRGLA